jgi:soluble lytic murein transglycosylase-like protein
MARIVTSREVRRSPRRATFPADFPTFLHAIKGQESNFRYGVANAEGSGAMGVGQVMPATGATLARRMGLPWRPDLMAGTSQEARQYQDAITEAAAREAWQASGGDLRRAAMYYHGGSNERGWGPKTRRYADEVLTKLRNR